LARILPNHEFNLLGLHFNLNPGPFNRKEHTIIAIMAIGTTSFDSGSVASDVYIAFIKYLNIPVSLGFKLMFLLTTQGLAFGVAGIYQRLVVDPAYCVWPATLPTCSLLHSMHDNSFQSFTVGRWSMPRMKFFWIVLGCVAVYQFIPGYLFTALSTFAWITWIAPDNVALNQVFGSTSGMDLLPLTWDWNVVTGYLGSPLAVPAWAIANVAGAGVFILWILAPACVRTHLIFFMLAPSAHSQLAYDRYRGYSCANTSPFDSIGVMRGTASTFRFPHRVSLTTRVTNPPMYHLKLKLF
jgi:hypothetical protein